MGTGGLDLPWKIISCHLFSRRKTGTPPPPPPPTPAPGVQTIYDQTQAPPPITDKIIQKFSGYMHEDGPKFLQEFGSYLTVSGVDQEQRIIAAFHLHLKGPALTWFHTLPTRDNWATIKQSFNCEYGNN